MKKLLTVFINPLITFTFCFIVVCQSPVFAQTLNNELREGVLPSQMFDTRSLSMAGTTIADLYGRPSIGINPALSAMYLNPTFIQFNTNYNWDSNLMMYHMTLPTLAYGPHHVTARFGFLHRGFENFPFTSPPSTTEPDITMYRGELAYAIALSDHFSLGTLHSISYTTNKYDQSWNYFADIGLLYIPDGNVSYGLIFRGIGSETTYSFIRTGQTIFDNQLARQRMEIGITFRYPIEKRTYLSISFANEKQFGLDGLWYKAGIEIKPLPYIAVRGGAVVNFDQSLFIPRAGFGVNAGMFLIDYTIAPKYIIGEQFHQFGVTVQF